jgi:hypothetical protein
MAICRAEAHQLSPAAQLPAAAVEALLRLLLQLHARHSNRAAARLWWTYVTMLCRLPGAEQLPTATVVELVQQAVQSPGARTVLFAAQYMQSYWLAGS